MNSETREGRKSLLFFSTAKQIKLETFFAVVFFQFYFYKSIIVNSGKKDF